MKWAGWFAACALSLLPGCFDSLVGSPCKDGLSHCPCTSNATCALDGGIDGGGLDSGMAEGEAGAGAGPYDVTPSLDLATSLDEGYDGSPVDGDRSDARPTDLARTPDRPSDPVSNADRPDGPRDVADLRAPDAADARPPDGPGDARDVPLLSHDDAGDAADAEDTADLVELADRFDDATEDLPDVSADGAESGADVPPSSDLAGPLLDLPDDVHADDERSDLGPDMGPDLGHDLGPDLPPCPDQQARCNGLCVDVQSDQENCGLCGNACSAQICTAGQCQSCSSNQTVCGNQCIDTSADPANCGACGHVCTTGICGFGTCKATTSGQIIIIGHDYLTSNAVMNRLLGNAIFQASGSSVRLAEYVGVSTPAAVNNTHAAITQVGNTLGRSATSTVVDGLDLATMLAAADVLLVQSQTAATNTILIQLGQGWTSTLATFVHTGGIVVLLDGSYPTNLGTSQIISSTGLMSVVAFGSVSNDTCTIATASDPVASPLSGTYPCLRDSTTFAGDGVHVVEDAGQPVVLHLVF